MTDAEYAEQKARVERYTERWLGPLGLADNWHVQVCWHREKAEQEKGDARPAMMEAEVRWQYADATIHVYLPSVFEVEDDAVLEKIVVHEYQHILLNELRSTGKSMGAEYLAHEEHAATMLAMAFLRTAEMRNVG